MGKYKQEADAILERVRKHRIIKEALQAHSEVDDKSWIAERILVSLELYNEGKE